MRETSLFLSVFRMDKLHMALTELCYAINHCNVIQVWEHGFVPREFFIQHLETRFNKYVYDYLCNKIYENIPLYFHNQGTLKFKNNVQYMLVNPSVNREVHFWNDVEYVYDNMY